MCRLIIALGMFGLVGLIGCAEVQAQEAVNVEGKWVGTWSTGDRMGPWGLELIQSENNLSGTVTVEGRPVSPANYTADVKGRVKGQNILMEYTTPEGYSADVRLTLGGDGTLKGVVYARHRAAQVVLSRAK